MQDSQDDLTNIFQQIQSNITKHRAQLSTSTPKVINIECNCSLNQQQKQLETEFYQNQHQLVLQASALLINQNNALSNLLGLISEYLQKLVQEVKKQRMCACRWRKIQFYNEYSPKIEMYEEYRHKIDFLRQQNHKFFKMIEIKNEECQQLKIKITQLQRAIIQISQKSDTSSFPLTIQSKLSQCQQRPISSRTISQNSSRVSQFRVPWPELMFPVKQGAHKTYFQQSPGQRQTFFNEQPRLLKQKNGNQISKFGQVQLGFKRSKIFCGSCFPN